MRVRQPTRAERIAKERRSIGQKVAYFDVFRRLGSVRRPRVPSGRSRVLGRRIAWPAVYRGSLTAIGSIRLGSLFRTLPTHTLTGQQVISSPGYGARRALSWGGSAGSSPSQAGQPSGFRTTGILLCIS